MTVHTLKLKRLSVSTIAAFLAISGSVTRAHAYWTPGNGGIFSDKGMLVELDEFAKVRKAITNLMSDPAIQALTFDRLNSLTLVQRIEGQKVETTKFRHFYKGIEVFGSTAFHHFGPAGTEIRNTLKHFDLDIQPALSEGQAVSLAKAIAGDRAVLRLPELKIFPSDEGDSARLIYWVELAGAGIDGHRRVLIDAHTGDAIADLPDHLTLAPIQVFSAKNTGISVKPIFAPAFGLRLRASSSMLTGCEVTDLATGATRQIDPRTCNALEGRKDICQIVIKGSPAMIMPSACQLMATSDGMSAQADFSAKQAFQNSLATLKYYSKNLGRESFDGKGSPLVNIVHGGIAYSNAHWNLSDKRMVYGDGDGKVLGDFTLALDVAGHEMTHGVTAETSNLLGMGESGALNEAYSDFFGKMVEGSDDWAVGRKLFLNSAAAKGVRDLAEPANLTYRNSADPANDGRPYPAHMNDAFKTNETCGPANDYCFVHINATIPGHASYLIQKAIGRQKAERLYYVVLTQGLSEKSTIRDAAAATRLLCKQMFDRGTCATVDAQLAAVGM